MIQNGTGPGVRKGVGRSCPTFMYNFFDVTVTHQFYFKADIIVLSQLFVYKNGSLKIVFVHEVHYFVKRSSNSNSCYTEDKGIKMVRF